MAEKKNQPEQAAEPSPALISAHIAPRFDVESPEFNPVLGINEAVKEAQALIEQKSNQCLFDVDEEIHNIIGLANVLQEIILPEVTEAIKTKHKKSLPDDNAINAANIVTRSISQNIADIKSKLAYFERLNRYITDELKKPKYNGATLEQLRDKYTDENKNPIKGSPLDMALIAARKAAAAATIEKPTHYTMPNGKPVNAYLDVQDCLTKIDNNGQITFFPIQHENNLAELTIKNATKKTPEVIDFISITYSGDLDGKAAKIKPFDQSIYNGIASLVNAGNTTFLLEDLYKVVTQKTKPTQKQLDNFENSLRKFSGTRLRLDVTQELEAGLLTEDGELITQGIIEDALLNYRAFTIVTDKGTKKTGIELINAPVLYEYSRRKDQLINIPINLLEVNGKATEETIAIRDYLLHEINQLKKGFRDNRVINYEALLKHINFDFDGYEKNRTAKSRITDIIISLLDGWINKGWINGYKISKIGKSQKISGFEIIT